MRRFLRGALATSGCKLVEATTASEGLSLAAAHPPDVILLDLGLPDMDGIEVTRRLREWTTTPILVLSARGQDKDKVAARDDAAPEVDLELPEDEDALLFPFAARGVPLSDAERGERLRLRGAQ